MTGGRVVLITGSSANTGLTMARYFAARGDTVVVNGRNADAVGAAVKELRAAGGTAVPGVADITRPDSVADLLQAAEREAGPVDVLIHSATLRHHAPIGQLSYQQWSDVIATTLTGGFLTAQAVAGGMAARGRGSILFIGGHSGQSGAAGGTATTAAKSGLLGLTKSLARELAPAGVTVNCLSPGFVRTERDGDSDARAGGRVPLGRFGTQDEIAASAYFLTGPDAAYITGQVMNVNGGVYM
jgi:3-oxoacyl-[acyl-carrier protein] reductase